jgi:DMSO/TMAO reductase YedYZ molybdopterin-dependent catalytic subunit
VKQDISIGPKGGCEETGRRFFLRTAALFTLTVCFPLKVWSFFITRLEVRTVEKGDFRFNPATGMVTWKGGKRREPYRLTVEGLVDRPATLSYQDLRGFPLVNQTSDFHCVEGWSVKGIRWKGFRFEELLRRVKPKPEARFAVFHALGKTTFAPGGLDHYVENLPISELLDPKKKCILALEMDGRPLTNDHGAPLRLVSPYDLGYKSAKYVVRIELTETPQPGWWTLANPVYPTEAPVPPERLRKG